MSFIAPVILEHRLGAANMGLILATSSMAGTVTDFLFAKIFGGRRASFFIKIMLALAAFFPISFLVYQSIPSFIFAMIIWGVYFEAMIFSIYHTVHQTVPAKDHVWAWGTITTVRNIGWVAGPLLAGYLDGYNSSYPIIFSLASFSVAIFLFLFQKKNHPQIKVVSIKKRKSHGFIQELKIWFVCAKVFWPLLFLMLMFQIIDSTFFSIGPVFAEDLQGLSHLGGLFIAMYTVPSLIFGILTGYFARPWGKKRAAFLAGIVAGIGLIAMSQAGSVEWILATTFFASMGMAIIYPELSAVFEDFVARGKKAGNDIVGLTAVVSSISYIIGPIVNGFLAEKVGTQAVFGLWGWIIVIFSVIALFTVKRKLHLPQQELDTLLQPHISSMRRRN